MSYKSILFFCTAILCLDTEMPSKNKVEEFVIKGVDWERFVLIASTHYILPALYIQFQKADLLHLLPCDLVVYLKHISTQNKKRNSKLLEEVLELNNLLSSNNINPIFLKGSAHLCLNLYTNNAERMIGDIDLLVAPNEMIRTANILVNVGYKTLGEFNAENFDAIKHYPRMCSKDKLMAVEIHKDVVQNRNHRQLNYETINSTKQKVNGVFIPSLENLVLHNAINTQMNDKHYLFGKINLRQQYDLNLLSKKIDVQKTFADFKFYRIKLNSYLIKTACLFQDNLSLHYPKNIFSCIVENSILLHCSFPKAFKYANAVLYCSSQSVQYSILIVEHLAQPKGLKILICKISSLEWFKRFLRQNVKAMFSN